MTHFSRSLPSRTEFRIKFIFAVMTEGVDVVYRDRERERERGGLEVNNHYRRSCNVFCHANNQAHESVISRRQLTIDGKC